MKVVNTQNFELDLLCSLDKNKYPFLLESVSNNTDNRYSILFANPGDKIELNNLDEFDFLQKLESKVKTTSAESDLPFVGGYFVYLSYELIGQIETVLAKDLHFADTPLATAVYINSAVIFDHLQNQTFIVDADDNQARIADIVNDIGNIKKQSKTDFSGNLYHEDDKKFLDGVDKIKDYIVAGDVFQVNLSRKWNYELDKNIKSTQIYKALKQSNPAPFSALAQFDSFSIISSSPERLFSVSGDIIQTRPIAGTHPRGSGDEDEVLKDRLINHPKEQAEHIMLLDLERNDLGRVCEYGSVKVDDIMFLETYPYVHHIVSNIRGKLKKDATIKDIVRALFPGGTITGCPKVRCMQIIAELEQQPRAAYTGSLGYISNNGNMDFNILIRTITKQNKNLSFRAGAGIVFDSIATNELEETKHKAEGLLKVFN